jgi:hypothetical protein
MFIATELRLKYLILLCRLLSFIDVRTAVLTCCVAGSGDGRVSVYLNRLTGFDHQCRVRYNIVLGENDMRLESGIMDDVSDTDGKGYGWHPRTRFNDLVYKVG